MGKDVTSLVIIEHPSLNYAMDWLDTLTRFTFALVESKTHGHGMPVELGSDVEKAFTETVNGYMLTSLEIYTRGEEVFDVIKLTTGRKFAVMSVDSDYPDNLKIRFGNMVDPPEFNEEFDLFNRELSDYKNLGVEKFLQVLEA